IPTLQLCGRPRENQLLCHLPAPCFRCCLPECHHRSTSPQSGTTEPPRTAAQQESSPVPAAYHRQSPMPACRAKERVDMPTVTPREKCQANSKDCRAAENQSHGRTVQARGYPDQCCDLNLLERDNSLCPQHRAEQRTRCAYPCNRRIRC